MASVIHTTNAPAAVGPYSQAMDCGDFVFCSGQIPLVPETGLMVEGGIEAQACQMFANIKGQTNFRIFFNIDPDRISFVSRI